MDRELLRTLRQATRNHANLLYHSFVAHLAHLLVFTLLVVVAPQLSTLTPNKVRALWGDASNRVSTPALAMACWAAMLVAYTYASSRPQPVYLVDMAGYKAPVEHEASRAKTIVHFSRCGRFSEQSMAFQKRMLERSGLGEATHFPMSLIRLPVDMCDQTAMEESHAVIFGVVDEILRKTGVDAGDVGVLIFNSSLLSPTPSFTSLIVNRYKFRDDIVTHNLSGMGCSAGIIAIDLAKRLLQGREGDFLDSLVTALSPPRIRGISRLPSAPAAGGWGIPGSLRVNRVGVWGLPLAALWGRWCGRWFFGVDVLPLRWWSSGGAPSRGRRPCRARGSADPPCAAFFSFCCGAAALELCCSSRAGREAGASPATDLLAAEARWGIGARGAPPYAFIVKCSVAARRAVQAASLKGLKVPRQWHGGCRPSSPSPAKLRLSVVALDPPPSTTAMAAPPLLAALSAVLVLVALCCGNAHAQTPVFACDASNATLSAYGFCDRAATPSARAKDLASRLTLAEKVGFLVSTQPALPRLGIPAYEWWSEALHGVSYVGPGTKFSPLVPGATSFPQPILTAASFNASLFRAIGEVVSTEARAMHNVGLAGLTFWSPNINIFRDPRWGRGQETPGEDPLLASKYAVGYVTGLQDAGAGNATDGALKVAACCKHYTAYDVDNWKGVERYTFDAKVSQQDLDDTFQPPFKSCVLDGNVASVMCSYNKVNGKPTCADKDLLAGVIRGDWKLNGYIVSDCDSVDVLYTKQHYTKTPEEAAAITIKSGLDLNCGTFLQQHTVAAVQAGEVSEEDVDRAITNNFIMLMRLGFFDGDPRKLAFGGLGPSDVCTSSNQELARETARQGIVLLKNSGALPLTAKSIKSMAVIGPNANASFTMIGNYEGTPCKYTTPLQGLGANVDTVYQPGCSNVGCSGNSLQLSTAVAAAASADVTVLVVGADQSLERESLDRTSLLLPGQQPELVSAVANASRGPVILVVMSGGPFDISFAKVSDKISAILWVGYPGEAGGAALADILFGKHNPSGRLPVTWYPASYADTVTMTDMRMRPDTSTGYPGRTYRFYTGETVFAFGDGLSYTTMSHSLLSAPPPEVPLQLAEGHACRGAEEQCASVEAAGDHCEGLAYDVRLRVRNAGAVAGAHTVLLFSSPPAVHGAPAKHLLGFEKVSLAPGEAGTVAFRVDVCKDLSVVDELGVRKVALGGHTLHVGDLKHTMNLRV